MKISITLFLTLLISIASFAQQEPALVPAPILQDLVLPGEKWVATHNSYLCEAFGDPVAAPLFLDQYQVKFERITTDSTLDNALLRASFVENGNTCRYNAILFADNAEQNSTLLQSIAYNTNSGASAYKDCLGGKKVLDEALAKNDYLYYGHPHNLAFMMPGQGAEVICGEKALIGVNFVVTGKLQ